MPTSSATIVPGALLRRHGRIVNPRRGADCDTRGFANAAVSGIAVFRDGSPSRLESGRMSVEAHFLKTDPTVRAIYQRLIEVARAFGPVTEDPKKTSIHLVRHGIRWHRDPTVLADSYSQVGDGHPQPADPEARADVGSSLAPRGASRKTGTHRSTSRHVAQGRICLGGAATVIERPPTSRGRDAGG